MTIQRKKKRVMFRDIMPGQCFTFGDCVYAKLDEGVIDSDGDMANAIALDGMFVIRFNGDDEVVPTEFVLVEQ